MNRIFIICLLLPFLFSNQFVVNVGHQKDELIGRWVELDRVKIAEEKPDTVKLLSFNESSDELKQQLTFFGEGRGMDHLTNEEFKYSLKEGILKLGNRRFHLKKLTTDILVLCDVEENSYKDLYCITFKRE